MIDQRRFAQRQPRSLQPEQLGDLPVTSTLTPQKVRAWVVWEDGVEELIDGVAYDGNGNMVHAPRTGKTVEVVHDVFSDPYYASQFALATRPGGATVMAIGAHG